MGLDTKSSLEQIQALEVLVDELVKDRVSEKRIQDLMEKVGLEFTSDPIERMNRVLLRLHEGRESKVRPVEA